MAKKSSMQEEVEVGEQMALIDVLPKKAKPIIAEAKVLRKFQIDRASAQDKENNQRAKLLGLIADANIPRLPDGKLKFSYDSVTITVTPKAGVDFGQRRNRIKQSRDKGGAIEKEKASTTAPARRAGPPPFIF